jgi:hypothetical protein
MGGNDMKRAILALAILAGWTLPAAADGCFICTKDSACGQYCRYSGQDNADTRKKCAAAGCKIGGTASCPTGVNIKTCRAEQAPFERLRDLAALAEERTQ